MQPNALFSSKIKSKLLDAENKRKYVAFLFTDIQPYVFSLSHAAKFTTNCLHSKNVDYSTYLFQAAHPIKVMNLTSVQYVKCLIPVLEPIVL